MKCGNEYCRKEVDRLYPIKSQFDIWDVCLSCSKLVTITLNRLLKRPTELKVEQ